MLLGSATFYDASLTTTASTWNSAAFQGLEGRIELDPRLGLSWLDRGVELRADYFPRLTVQDQASGLLTLHRASANGNWQLSSTTWRALASVDGAYGTSDVLTLALPSQPGQPVQPIPAVTTLPYGSGEVAVGLTGMLSPRQRLATKLSAAIAGGTDPAARTLLPLDRTGRFTADLEWTASPLDTLVSGLSFEFSSIAAIHQPDGQIANDVMNGYVVVSEAWRRALTPDTLLRLRAGPTLMGHRFGNQTTWTFLPSGEIGIRDQWWRRVDVDLGVVALPMVDRISGALYERADATVALAWHPTATWVLSVTGSGGIVAQGPQAGGRIAGGDIRMAWSPVSWWDVGTGIRGAYQMPRGPGASDFKEGSAYVSMTLRNRDRL
jgi:hypothetical protein